MKFCVFVDSSDNWCVSMLKFVKFRWYCVYKCLMFFSKFSFLMLGLWGNLSMLESVVIVFVLVCLFLLVLLSLDLFKKGLFVV